MCLWSLFLWDKQSDLLSLRQRLTWTALVGKVVCFHLKHFVMQRCCVHCVAVCNWSRTWLAAMRSVCSFWMRRFMAFSSSSFLWLISSIFVLQTIKNEQHVDICSTEQHTVSTVRPSCSRTVVLTCCRCTEPPSLPADAENWDRTTETEFMINSRVAAALHVPPTWTPPRGEELQLQHRADKLLMSKIFKS